MKTTAQSIPSTEDLRSGLQLAIESREHELTSLKQALAWLNTPAPAAAPQEKPERQATQKPGRKPKGERTPKQSKKAAPTKKKAPAKKAARK